MNIFRSAVVVTPLVAAAIMAAAVSVAVITPAATVTAVAVTAADEVPLRLVQEGFFFTNRPSDICPQLLSCWVLCSGNLCGCN